MLNIQCKRAVGDLSKQTKRIFVFLVAVMLLSTRFVSQAASETNLPSGKEIFESSIISTGGSESFAKLDNRRLIANMLIGEAKTRGVVTTYSARPNKSYSRIEIEGLGIIEQGTLGDVIWIKQPGQKTQIIDGVGKDMELFMANFDLSDFDTYYESAETKGIEKISGLNCYKVVFKPKGALPAITTYYTVAHGLPLKTEYEKPHPDGSVKIASYSSQFEIIDDVILPRKTLEYALGEKTVFTVIEIAHHVELPEGCFDLPADVQAMLDAKD